MSAPTLQLDTPAGFTAIDPAEYAMLRFAEELQAIHGDRPRPAQAGIGSPSSYATYGHQQAAYRSADGAIFWSGFFFQAHAPKDNNQFGWYVVRQSAAGAQFVTPRQESGQLSYQPGWGLQMAFTDPAGARHFESVPHFVEAIGGGGGSAPAPGPAIDAEARGLATTARTLATDAAKQASYAVERANYAKDLAADAQTRIAQLPAVSPVSDDHIAGVLWAKFPDALWQFGNPWWIDRYRAHTGGQTSPVFPDDLRARIEQALADLAARTPDLIAAQIVDTLRGQMVEIARTQARATLRTWLDRSKAYAPDARELFDLFYQRWCRAVVHHRLEQAPASPPITVPALPPAQEIP